MSLFKKEQTASSPSSENEEESSAELKTLARIVSGEMIETFTAEVAQDSEETGAPETLSLIRRLLSTITAEPEQKPSALTLKMASPSGLAGTSDFVRTARAALDKRRSSMSLRNRTEEGGPQGEALSEALLKIDMIPIDKIKEDPTFVNTRVDLDVWEQNSTPGQSGQSMSSLKQSMMNEGLKVPIILIATDSEFFFIRAGFRRTKCARELKWKRLPAIVLASNTPAIKEYWANILENATRKNLSTYEMAHAAQIMRDKFSVSTTDFAAATGFSTSYISNLLSCIDRLPDHLIEQWKIGAKLNIREWYQLSLLDHYQADRMFKKWTGQSVRNLKAELEAREKNKSDRTLAPSKWMTRMQKLWIGIEGAEGLETETRNLCLKIIAFCMGQTNKIPGVYEPQKHRDYERRAQLRRELRLPGTPNPGDEDEMPEPQNEVEDEDDGVPFEREAE